MARIICDPAIADVVAECEVVQKLSRCCDVFGVDGIKVNSLQEWGGDVQVIGIPTVGRSEYLTWYHGQHVAFRVGRYVGQINWAFSQIFSDHSAELHTLHGLTDDGKYDHLTTVCVRVCVGVDGWPAVRVSWSDGTTNTVHEWMQSDREAVDMAAAACRQSESKGIYLDWLEDRLGVAVRDRDEMMRYICEKQEESSLVQGVAE